MSFTDKQEKFMELIFSSPEHARKWRKAAREAGYSDETHMKDIVAPLEEEIQERTRKFISRESVKAAMAMSGIIDNPTDLGNKEKMAAAKDILDRAGFKATDKVEVKASDPLFILPPKKEDNETED